MSDMIELARRAVACKALRWMPRMVDTHGRTVLDVDMGRHGSELDERMIRYVSSAGGGGWVGYDLWAGESRWSKGPAIPDFSDPATLGALAEMVQVHLAQMADRDAAHYHGLQVAAAWQDWFMGRHDRRVAVLVAALESAP